MPFSNKLVNIAHELGKLYEFSGIDVDDDALAGAKPTNSSHDEVELKRTTSGSDNTIPKKDELPMWVSGWGERVNEAWKWQWEADAPERDFERAVGMLKSVIVRAES